ncbi:MAG: potassium transporter TrkG, partial [Tannerellaceae bacterium]
LMIIGASPMSTGGGIKTSTFAIALIASLNFAKNKEKLELYRREIMPSSIRRAFVIIMFYLIWICISVFLMSIIEKDKPIFSLIFEVISALGTVGLSLNLTPSLSEFSKVLIILTMFIGRIGVFMFISSFLKETPPSNYNYPKDSLLLG